MVDWALERNDCMCCFLSTPPTVEVLYDVNEYHSHRINMLFELLNVLEQERQPP